MKNSDIRKKNILIVCGHYMPEIGYQEVHLANVYFKLGYKVDVLSSSLVSNSSKGIIKEPYTSGFNTLNGINIHRLLPTFSINSFVYSKNLNAKIKEINPDIIIVIGVAKLFPNSLFFMKKTSTKIITLFGDNGDMSKSKRVIKTKILNFLIKKRLYINAIKNSHRIIFYTNETEDIIKSFVPHTIHSIIDSKKQNSSLGFDSSIFYYSSKNSKLIREKHCIENDTILLVTSTRLVAGKKIEKVIMAVNELINRGINIKYFIIGSMNNNYSKDLISFINKQKHPSNFTIFPFMTHQEICAYYNAADIGIWTRAAISIQEAMGTGLPILLPNNQSVSHLIDSQKNGIFYEYSENLIDVLNKFILKFIQNKEFDREKIAQMNKEKFSYEYIVKQMIKDL